MSFGAFVYTSFQTVNPDKILTPNWHIECVSHQLELMVTRRNRERLVLNLPPRTLKSFMASVALPAWLLGQDPSAALICASYSQELANKFSRDCRALVDSKFYKRIFPGTRLNPKKATESEFETTCRGYRLATSVGGTLTGRGCEFMIVDDPSKADDANSVVALQGASDWFHNTAMSRLDDPAKSVIILVQQRLHVKDLSGILIEKDWPSLVLPAIATEARDYIVGDGEIYRRPVGELLQPARDIMEDFENIGAFWRCGIRLSLLRKNGRQISPLLKTRAPARG